MGQLLEIHLLKKSARHQNLDCSTPFEQMTKIYETARKSKKYAVRVPRVNFEQMQVLDQNEQLLELLLLDKRFKKCQLLDNIFSKENGVHVRQIG